MEVYEAIAARKTVREFDARPVERKTLERMITAGLRAPSNDHMRSWEFIEVSDRALRAKLLHSVPKSFSPARVEMILKGWGLTDQAQRAMYLDAIPKQHAMLLSAPCLLLPVFRQSSPLLAPKTLSDLNAFAAMWCCIENLLIAAASEGIFGVTRIPFDKEQQAARTLLDIPDEYQPVCLLALGYPAPDAACYRQVECTAETRLHQNRW